LAPWGPPLYLYTTTTTGLDDEVLGLANAIQVPAYDGRLRHLLTSDIGFTSIKVEDTESDNKVIHTTNISAGNSASVEGHEDNADYQTSGAAKVVLIIRGSNTTLQAFTVYEDTTANAGTGTVLQTFTNLSMGVTNYITTKVLSVSSGKYITVKAVTGNVSDITGYVVE